jgi:hypothetical protein
MEQNPSEGANVPSYGQNILHLLRNRRAHYHFLKSPHLDPNLSQMNLAHTCIVHFFKIHINIVLLSKPVSSK